MNIKLFLVGIVVVTLLVLIHLGAFLVFASHGGAAKTLGWVLVFAPGATLVIVHVAVLVRLVLGGRRSARPIPPPLR